MIRSLLIALALGAVLGGGLVWYIQAGRIDAANARTQIAQEQKRGVEHDLEQCKAAGAIQNQAIEALRAKAKAANAALVIAQQDRDAAESQADLIMQERTPAGVPACEAARDAFAAELRRERVK